MDLDSVIDELLEADDTTSRQYHAVAKQTERRAGPCSETATTHSVGGEDTGTTDTKYHQHRERLAALAAGGRARQYLGKALSVDQVDNMKDMEVEKLYGRYEARLGAAMTKTLGAAALQLYTSVASMFLPIPPEEQPELLAELESDPFVEHAVSNATCEMYHRFGMYLAPVTAALTTLRHCRFGHHDVQGIDSCDGNRNSADTGTEECLGEYPDRVDGGDDTKCQSDNACASSSRGFADG